MNGVNLLPKRRLRAAALSRRAQRWIVGVIVYAVVMGVVCIWAWVNADSSEQDLRGELARANTRLIESQRRLDATTTDADRLERSLAAMRAVGEHPDWSVLLRLFAEHLGDDVVLESVEITPVIEKDAAPTTTKTADGAEPQTPKVEAYDIRVTGVGATQQRVMGYANDLQHVSAGAVLDTDQSVFSSVDIKRTYSVDMAGRACVGFVMECRLSARRMP